MFQEPQIAHLSKENEVILICLRTFLESVDKSVLMKFLGRDLDWAYMIQSAIYHRVIPIIYSSLNYIDFPCIPQAIINELKNDFDNNARKNLATTGELLRILSLLELSGISAISCKGPVLASSAYGDLSLRQFDDIDIIVPLSKVREIGAFLISQGYREGANSHSSMAQQAAMLKYQHHKKFYNNDIGVDLEIHWALSPWLYSLQRDITHLWDRTEEVILQGRKILGLSNEDTLLFLCEHGARHRWHRLSWICDIAALLRFVDLDWGYIISHARKWRSERTLFIGLFLAKCLLGAPIPDEANIRMVKDKKIRSLASEVIDNLFPNLRASNNILSDPVLCNIHDQLFYINASDRFSDRIRLYLRMATTPTLEDWTFLPLPDHVFFLYHFIRPIRQAIAHGQKMTQWLFR